MGRLSYLLIASILLAGAANVGAQAPGTEAAIERARRALEQDRVADALQVLEPLAKRPNVTADTLVLLSTAQFMIGETEGGRASLERALAIDPRHRQAWLNRAALDIAEGRHDEALAALRKAQEIDPQAPDNELNIGAVYILKGDIGQASRQFNQYLTRNRSSADAYYLVASNYTLASRWDLAMQHLEAAIRLDEKSRRRARVDPNFGPLSDYQPFQTLLQTDAYRIPDGFHRHRVVLDAPYDGSHGDLLKAVLNALQFRAMGAGMERRTSQAEQLAQRRRTDRDECAVGSDDRRAVATAPRRAARRDPRADGTADHAPPVGDARGGG